MPSGEQHGPWVELFCPAVPWPVYMMTGQQRGAGHHTKHYMGVPSLDACNNVMSQGHWGPGLIQIPLRVHSYAHLFIKWRQVKPRHGEVFVSLMGAHMGGTWVAHALPPASPPQGPAIILIVLSPHVWSSTRGHLPPSQWLPVAGRALANLPSGRGRASVSAG